MSLKRKKRVLAIDDEPAMTEWLKILLEHAGYEVRTEGEFDQALRSALADTAGMSLIQAHIGIDDHSSALKRLADRLSKHV